MRLHLVNAIDSDGRALNLGVADGRLTSGMDGHRIDLGGARLLPGLINAHDHLHLNGGLPRLSFRDGYRNASEWIADITPRLSTDSVLLAHRARPRAQRLVAGGLKNLLSGVTTVLHHDPRHPVLDAPEFPVDVPVLAGWSHSLALDGEAAVRASREVAAPGGLWVIHAAEGIDTAAALEFDRLDAHGCIAPGTMLVHGLGMSAAQQRRLVEAGAGLVWCPGSNLHLFGRTLDPGWLFERGGLALGSDSRISGGRDLLAELALVRELTGWHEARLEALVTEGAARLLGLHDRGRLAPGLRADLVALPPGLPLSRATRGDLRLVVVAGRPLYADADLGEVLGLVPVRVDGRAKAIAHHLVSAADEPGLKAPAQEVLA
ncbi:MAG: amidohydrolase family protein [Burkholderiales bacterium]|jgi:cytosine/adenosine deaminase-related metal-dependent hydrolase|nr:amidohydrolase family protein [Burkholderiales bacterium]